MQAVPMSFRLSFFAACALLSPFAVHAVSTDVVAQRALAQQGFAIALASNVLQSHLLYVELASGSYTHDGTCSPLDDNDAHAGGISATAPGSMPDDDFFPHVVVTIWYDGACTKKYITADAHVTQSGDTYAVTNLVNQYYAVDGVTPLVTLTTTAAATLTDTTLSLNGLGTLTAPTGHTQAANLGLVCNAVGAGTNQLACAGGIVQNFASIGTALGSVSPLTLTLPDEGDTVTFASPAPAAFRSGVPDALSLAYTNSSHTALVVNGGGAFGSDTTAGSVAEFSLLPPPPTGWTSDDTGHDLRFTIAVLDATTRNLGATITRRSTGATLGTATLDQSGSGIVTFSDGSGAEVRGWVLSDTLPDTVFVNNFEGMK